MDRLELAKEEFRELAAASQAGLDEKLSDRWEKWASDDVVPVVEQLLVNPRFRREAIASVIQLTNGSEASVRTQVERVARALESSARSIMRWAHASSARDLISNNLVSTDAECLRDLEGSGRPIDKRSAVEKLTQCPWFDLATAEDFFLPTWHLNLQDPDELLTCQFRAAVPDCQVLGDSVAEMLLARVAFWSDRLDAAWHRLSTGSTSSNPQPNQAHQDALAAKFEVDDAIQQLRENWLLGGRQRLRDACCTLLKVYLAYHRCPDLPWIGWVTQQLSVHGSVLRSYFRRPGTIYVVERTETGECNVVETRKVPLIDLANMRRVAKSLHDVTSLYQLPVSPDDAIQEAIEECRLVVVAKPRLVYWGGVLLDTDWSNQDRIWQLLLALAQAAERGTYVTHQDLEGLSDRHGLSARKNRLSSRLMAIEGDSGPAGAQLAASIDRMQRGRCALDLPKGQVKVLDLGDDHVLVDLEDLPAAATL